MCVFGVLLVVVGRMGVVVLSLERESSGVEGTSQRELQRERKARQVQHCKDFFFTSHHARLQLATNTITNAKYSPLHAKIYRI